MRRRLRLTIFTLLLALLLLALLLLPGVVLWLAPPHLPWWVGPYYQGRCLGPCCLITKPFTELSCGEYSRSPSVPPGVYPPNAP